MDRAPGLSVRLKLTLSYAGFLMLAGALLLAVVWVFLLRYVPDREVLRGPGGFGPGQGGRAQYAAPREVVRIHVLSPFLVLRLRKRA